MNIIAHPASKSQFDRLLLNELQVTHNLMLSLMPILQNFATLSEAIRIAAEDGIELSFEDARIINASLFKLSETLTERSEKISYYRQMGSFA
jgi:hypothetical protein